MAPVSDKLVTAQGEPHRRARSAAADAAGGRVVPPTARRLSGQQKGEPVFAFVPDFAFATDVCLRYRCLPSCFRCGVTGSPATTNAGTPISPFTTPAPARASDNLRSYLIAPRPSNAESCPMRYEPGVSAGVTIWQPGGCWAPKRADHHTDGDRHERRASSQLGTSAPGAARHAVAAVPAGRRR